MIPSYVYTCTCTCEVARVLLCLSERVVLIVCAGMSIFSFVATLDLSLLTCVIGKIMHSPYSFLATCVFFPLPFLA